MTLLELQQQYISKSEFAKSTGMTGALYSKLFKKGYIPYDTQKRIEMATDGALKARKEDAVPKRKITLLHPSYRYYDEEFGLCHVHKIICTRGAKTKYVYTVNGITKTGMDEKMVRCSADIYDNAGDLIFEGDVIRFKNGRKMVFKNTEQQRKSLINTDFKIVLEYERPTDGKTETCGNV